MGPTVHIHVDDIKRLAPGSGLLRFAHHPHCDRHIHHLIWIKGHPFCLGCTSMMVGIPAGVLIAAAVNWAEVPLYIWIIGHGMGVVPAAIQPLVQRKWYKILARAILGATSASYFSSGLLFRVYFQNEWLWRSCVVFAFAACFLCLYKWRQIKIDDPCKQCPRGSFPTCDWNMPRLLAANVNETVWKTISDDRKKQ